MDAAAVIFDMDGVIVDSERYWEQEQRKILATTVPDADVTSHDVRGMNVLDQYDHLEDRFDPAVTRDQYFDLYDEKAATVYREKAELMDGFRGIVTMIRDGGLQIAVCSSSFRHWISMVLDRFDLENVFDAVVSVEDVDGPGKPDPHIYRHAAQRLDVDPERCVVVEDSAHGATAAKNAGMYCIGYVTDPGRDGDLSHADTVVHDPEELRDALSSML